MYQQRLVTFHALVGFAFFITPITDCLAQAPTTEDEKQQQHSEASRLNAEVLSLYDANKFAEAIPVAQKHVQLMLELFGLDHPKHLMSLENLALVYEAAGQKEQARPLFEKVTAARKLRCEQLLKHFHELPVPGDGDTDEQRQLLINEVEEIEAELLDSVGVVPSDSQSTYKRARERYFALPPPLGGNRYDNVDDLQKAIDATQNVLKHQIDVLGETSPTIEWTRALLCLLLREANEASAAKDLVAESRATWVNKFGESSPRAGWLSGYLGEILWRNDPSAFWVWELDRWRKIGETSREAENRDRELLALEAVVRIQRDELRWDSAMNEAIRLAELYELRGDLQRAAHWQRQYAASVTLRSAASHEATMARIDAERLDLLSRLDVDQKAEVNTALERLRQATKSLHNGQLEDAMNDSRAVRNVLQRLAGNDHILTISSEIVLGSVLLRMQRIEEATTALESVEKRLEWLGPFSESSISGGMLGDFGDCLLRTDPVRAKELHQRAVRQLAKAQVLWSDNDLHWREICSRHALAELAWASGDLQEAWRQLSEVLSGCHIHRERTFHDLPEVGQFQALRQYQSAVDDYLSVSTTLNRDVTEEYDVVVGWKGVSLRRLGRWRSISTRRANTDPRAMKALKEIESIVRRLSALRLAPDAAKDPNREAESHQLRQHLSEWEAWLDGISTIRMNAVQSGLQLGDGTLAHTAVEILNWSTRNPEIALVDYFEYEHSTAPAAQDQPWTQGRRLLCYVLRGGQIERFSLGDAAEINDLGTAWLNNLQGIPQRKSELRTPETQLRKRIWEPIDEAVNGAGLIVISPIGVLTQIPFAALPGRRLDTFLIEDHTLTYVSAMQLMQDYFVESFDDPEIPSLVCLGGVDFADGSGNFASLPGTAKEANQIDRMYRETHPNGASILLKGSDATKTSLFENAAKAQYLLLATHGFSIDEDSSEKAISHARISIKGDEAQLSAASAFPDLRSGLILAEGNDLSRDGIEKNWLTAAEAAYLPLSHCRLVILSACETGIGQLEGNEGMLSLQRGLQIAGAEATISSLWKVPDDTTQLLMIRFFENHWKRNMGKAAALREAQLWLLRGEYKASPELRGAKIEGPPESAGPLPAVYWAGFTLNGNWE